jgi:hypothetical protein
MPPAVAHLSRTLIALLAISFLCACSLRPQPEPPPAQPHVVPTLLSAEPASPAAMTGGSLSGAPGAVSPGATIRAYNLDTSLPPSETIAAPDGSFEMLLDMLPGDEVRLQATLDGARSKPLDVVIGETVGVPSPASRPFAACLTTADEISFGVIPQGSDVDRSVTLSNACAVDVTLSAIEMRRPVAGLGVVTDALPIVVEAGSSYAWTVRVQVPPGTSGEIEDVLIVEVDAPERNRRPVTLRADVEP